MAERENTREGIDAALADFTTHMRHKLLLTRHRSHWKNDGYVGLLAHLAAEVTELHDAIAAGDRKKIVREAADVGNFAMMICDNAQWDGTGGPNTDSNNKLASRG